MILHNNHAFTFSTCSFHRHPFESALDISPEYFHFNYIISSPFRCLGCRDVPSHSSHRIATRLLLFVALSEASLNLLITQHIFHLQFSFLEGSSFQRRKRIIINNIQHNKKACWTVSKNVNEPKVRNKSLDVIILLPHSSRPYFSYILSMILEFTSTHFLHSLLTLAIVRIMLAKQIVK